MFEPFGGHQAKNIAGLHPTIFGGVTIKRATQNSRLKTRPKALGGRFAPWWPSLWNTTAKNRLA